MKKTLIIMLLLAVQTIALQAQEKVIAFSFDDGPNTTTTVHMLDVLKKHGVKASFFVIGKNINAESAEVMKRAHREGHDIENHSLTHSHMATLTADSIRAEIAATSALVEQYVGERPQFFRPPYINVSQTMYDNIQLGFISGASSEDWLPEVTVDMRVERIVNAARDGMLYLLHDFEGNEQTVEAIDRAIPILKERGFRFVTVRQMFREKGITPERNLIYTDVRKPVHLIQ